MSASTPRHRRHHPAALLLALLLAAPVAAQDEIWRLVGTEYPAVEWDYADGRFTRDGATAHYIREPGGERLDVRFSWTVPAELTAGMPGSVELVADVIAGWECRPLFLGARVFLTQSPCAFCVDSREVGAGICSPHDDGMRAFGIEPGNFGQQEARLHVRITDGSLFSATAVTYVYARGPAPATATATRTAAPPRTPTATPPRTSTRTSPPTPTVPTAGRIACGETVHGTLSDTDLDIFGDGTFADAYVFTLTQATTVRFSLTGDGFDPFLWIADPSNPDDWEALFQGGSPQSGRLAAGRYAVVANNTFPIAAGVYPYVLRMTCDGVRTPTQTATPSPTRSATRTASPTRPPPPTRTPPPIATRPRSATPSATASATATGTPPVDLVAEHIEVVQTIQDLRNSVTLVAYKRTFVRFHVRADGDGDSYAWTAATLRVELGGPGGPSEVLLPQSTDVAVQSQPERGWLFDSYVFELPRLYLSGTIFLTATLNPHDAPRERDRSNNTAHQSVTFADAIPLDLVLYRTARGGGGLPPEQRHVDRLLDGVQILLPIAEINLWERPYLQSGPLSYLRALRDLESRRLADLAHRAPGGPPARAYHYALWSEPDLTYIPGKTVRGLAWVGGFVATGVGDTPSPSDPDAAWEQDNSRADGVAAHELAHAVGRRHAEFCGAKDGAPYPYEAGDISPTLAGPEAIWGFNRFTRQVYPPSSTDVMTYCDNQWISDFTYEGLFERFRLTAGQRRAATVSEDRLLVVGTIDGSSGSVALEPLFVMPVLVEPDAPAAGEWAVVLRDAAGAELARHPFAPAHIDERPAAAAEPAPHDLFFSATVADVAGTQQVEIVGPGVSHVVSAGAAVPEITVRTPDGGGVLVDDPIAVTWEGFDADGDPLTYRVQYSADGGATWSTLATAVTGTRLEVARAQIRAGDAALFRVWVSDGIHSAYDDTDPAAVVRVRPPTADIVEPDAASTVARGQTIAFTGHARSGDGDPLRAEDMRWTSSIDGEIGRGGNASRADLSVGVHTVTFAVDDGQGGVAQDAVVVTVVATPDALPPAPPMLAAAPAQIALHSRGPLTASLTVGSSGAGAVRWQASASEPWIGLSDAAGETRATLTVRLVDGGMPAGDYRGTITLRGDAAQAVEVPVVARIAAPDAACAGDCDGNGAVRIEELVLGVGIALGNVAATQCPAVDRNEDGRAAIDEIIRAVGAALAGCATIEPAALPP